MVEEVVDRKSWRRIFMRIEDNWLECVVRSRKLFKTALLSMKKIGSGIFWVVAHAIASSKAAISASNEGPAGHQPKESCQVDW